MKKSFYTCLICSIILIFSACRHDDDITDFPQNPLDKKLTDLLFDASGGKGVNHFILPESDDLAAIPQDPLNPLSSAKVALGKLLFHETGLGISPLQPISTGTYSCASCHHAGAGFQAGRFQGISEGGMGFGQNGEGRQKDPDFTEDQMDVQPLRSPSAMNSAFQQVMLWNGQFGATGVNSDTYTAWVPGTPIETNNLGFEGVETQAIAGLKVHRMEIGDSILLALGYQPLFDAAFPAVDPSERYSRTNTGLAIAAYERTLLATEAPFQKWLRGAADAMSDQDKRGAILFFEKGNCVSCHNGPALNDMEFHALGMLDMSDCPEPTFKSDDEKANRGRGGFTGKSEDDFKFKTPQLYNLKDSPFYGHGASFRSIQQIVNYKNSGIKENPNVPDSQMDPKFTPLGLTDSEVNDIVAFLQNSLHDDQLTRYVPDQILSGNCFPFADLQSRIDLGCD